MDLWLDRFVRLSAWLTLLPLLAFVAPQAWLKHGSLTISDLVGMFHLRHWGLLVGCLGALLLWACHHRTWLPPVLLAVTVEKAGLVAMVALSWTEPELAGLHAAAAFDAVCVLVYGLQLWRLAGGDPMSPAAQPRNT